jgi:hypothetical protein
MRWTRYVARMERKPLHKNLFGQPEGTRLHGRPMRKWEDDTETDLKDRVWECGLDSCGPRKGSVAGCGEHVNEHSGSIKTGYFLLTARLSASYKGLCSMDLVSITYR